MMEDYEFDEGMPEEILEDDDSDEDAPLEEDFTESEDGLEEDEGADDAPENVEDNDGGEEEESLEERVSRLQAQNTHLLEQLTSVLGRSAPSDETKQVGKDAPQDDILGDFELDDVIDSREAFVQVIKKAISIAEERAIQRSLQLMPDVVLEYAERRNSIQQRVAQFYEDNSDLKDVKQVVGMVANQIASENPDWDEEKVFSESAVRTRKVLGMRQTTKTVPPSGKKPAFAKQRGTKKTKGSDSRTPQQKEIDELISLRFGK